MNDNDSDTTLIPDNEDISLLANGWHPIADCEPGRRTTAARVIRSTGRTQPLAGGGPGQMRASDADRDRMVERLNIAYSEGRLSKDEHDGRLESALSARTYADLDQLVTDLPAAPRPRWRRRHRRPRSTGSRWPAWPAGSHSSSSGRRWPSRRSCSATWPGARSSEPANRGRAWARGLGPRLGDGDPGHPVHRRRPGHVRRDARHRSRALSGRAAAIPAAYGQRITGSAH